MAKRKSTRGTRPSRNSGPRHRLRHESDRNSAAASRSVTDPPVAIMEKVAAMVHTKLLRACAVLDCTRFVLMYDDQLDADPRRPSYPDAIDVARDLMDEVVDALDRVNLRAARK